MKSLKDYVSEWVGLIVNLIALGGWVGGIVSVILMLACSVSYLSSYLSAVP